MAYTKVSWDKMKITIEYTAGMEDLKRAVLSTMDIDALEVKLLEQEGYGRKDINSVIKNIGAVWDEI